MERRKFQIHDAAAQEVADAKSWYIKQSIRSARGFADELDRALERILDDPLMWPKYLHGTWAVQFHRYPYLVVYKTRSALVQIIAVAHTSRRPGCWVKRRF